MDDQHERSATENSQAAVGGFNHVATLSEADMQDQMDQFTYIMHQKFLLGEDNEHLDYSKIDNDETLDDHWLRKPMMMLRRNTSTKIRGDERCSSFHLTVKLLC